MDLPQRKRNRLENQDYGEIGYYFVTLCTQNRQRLFNIEPATVGNDLCVVPSKDLCVVPSKDLCVVPSLQNQIIHKWIKETEHKYNNIKIDKYVIMPDHLHLIVNITERHAGRSLHDAMRFFKTMTTNEYIKGVKDNILPPFDKKLWQKSYYDHIIRNANDYDRTVEYIKNNPIYWILKQQTQDE